MRLLFAALEISFILTIIAEARTILVPSQYPDIQTGIINAVDGDTVLVADGIYTGEGNKDLDFGRRAIVVISENGPVNCIIDCESNGRGFFFHSGENSNSVVAGFTILNGWTDCNSIPAAGAGICCDNSSPVIRGCYLLRCRATDT